jgi:hypothetical protein
MAQTPCSTRFHVYLDVSGSMYVNQPPFNTYNRTRPIPAGKTLLDFMVGSFDRIGALGPSIEVRVHTFYSTVRRRPFDWKTGHGQLHRLMDRNRDGVLQSPDFPEHAGESRTDLAAVLREIAASATASPSPDVYALFTDGVHDAPTNLQQAMTAVNAVMRRQPAPTLVFFGLGPLTDVGQLARSVGASYIDITDVERMGELDPILADVLSGRPRIARNVVEWDAESRQLSFDATVVNLACGALRIHGVDITSTTGEVPLPIVPLTIPAYGSAAVRFRWSPSQRLPQDFRGSLTFRTGTGALAAPFSVSVVYEPDVVIHQWSLHPEGPDVRVRRRAATVLFPLRLKLDAAIRRPRKVELELRFVFTGGHEKETRFINVPVVFATVRGRSDYAIDVPASGFMEPSDRALSWATPYRASVRMVTRDDTTVALARAAQTRATINGLTTPEHVRVDVQRVLIRRHLFGVDEAALNVKVRSDLFEPRKQATLRILDSGRELETRPIRLVDGWSPTKIVRAWSRGIRQPTMALDVPGPPGQTSTKVNQEVRTSTRTDWPVELLMGAVLFGGLGLGLRWLHRG